MDHIIHMYWAANPLHTTDGLQLLWKTQRDIQRQGFQNVVILQCPSRKTKCVEHLLEEDEKFTWKQPGPAVIVMVMDYLKENSDFLFIHRDVSILYEEHALILKCLYNRKNGSLISLSLQFVHLSRCSLYQNVNYKMKVHYNMLKLSLYFTFVALTV